MPSDANASHDLLFGLLALQNALVARDQLVLAFASWTATPEKSLADAVESLLPILRAHTRPRPLTLPADRLADALRERGDPKAAIELLEALREDTERLDSRLDWLRPHLQSLIGGHRLRLGGRQAAADDLRAGVERMERSHLKPAAPVLAAARARLARLDAKDGKGQTPSPGR